MRKIDVMKFAFYMLIIGWWQENSDDNKLDKWSKILLFVITLILFTELNTKATTINRYFSWDYEHLAYIALGQSGALLNFELRA